MLESILQSSLTLETFLICTGVSLVLGLGTAALAARRGGSSRSFIHTLALLPAVVQVIIMMVNGNVGAGVAVAGAFSLVRFRSMPGSAREIGDIFLAMALGLASGMGYVVLAGLFFAVIGAFQLVLGRVAFRDDEADRRVLKITIPEGMDYDGAFDDIFEKYTRSAELEQVKTTHVGTLYELRYRIVPKDGRVPREFLDELRCRNGNLTISCGRLPQKDTL